MSAPTILLYDADANKSDSADGKLFVRSFPENPDNKVRTGGIEVLIPEERFEDRFFETTNHPIGSGDMMQKRVLNKSALCNYLCDVRRDPDDFELFRSTIEEIAAVFNLELVIPVAEQTGARRS